jgi:hypothetical protein
MGVQNGISVAQDRVIDPECTGDLKEGISDKGHVAQKLGTACSGQVVERGNKRVSQQDGVAGKVLLVA